MKYKTRFQKVIAEYFYFSKGQRLAMSVLLTVVVMLVGFRLYLQYNAEPQINATQTFELKAIEEWKVYHRDSSRETTEAEKAQWRIPSNEKTNKKQWQLHAFDPNTVSAEELLEMGFREKSVQTWMNYRNKGGRFKNAEDIMKLYGLYDDEKQKILPYITIASVDTKPHESNTSAKTSNRKTIIVSINAADTAMWKALPGIGEKLSARIVNFREKLGGFHSIEQIAETYALPDSTFQKIKPQLQLDNLALRKININTATADELSKHPYINFKQAKFIVNFRQQHGNFTQADVLLQTPELFDQSWYSKTSPYLEW